MTDQKSLEQLTRIADSMESIAGTGFAIRVFLLSVAAIVVVCCLAEILRNR